MYEIIMQLPFNGFHVKGILSLPVKAKSIIIFSHGFGSVLLSPHEKEIAKEFQSKGLGTLVFDLLDQNEGLPESYKDFDLLSRGLITATDWLHGHSEYRSLDLGYFGSGTGAATALKAASELGFTIKTTVSLSGRLDLIKHDLARIPTPVLLIAGEFDFKGVNINKEALEHLRPQKQMAIVPGASALFEEPGKTKETANIALSWYKKFLSIDKQPLLQPK